MGGLTTFQCHGWVEKGGNETQFRFIFIISVLDHPMNVYEGKWGMFPLEKGNEQGNFSKGFEIFNIGTIVH